MVLCHELLKELLFARFLLFKKGVVLLYRAERPATNKANLSAELKRMILLAQSMYAAIGKGRCLDE